VTLPSADPNPTGTSGAGPVVLSEEEVRPLREAGLRWAATPRAKGARGQSDGDVDPDLDRQQARGSLPGDRYIRGGRARRKEFDKVAEG